MIERFREEFPEFYRALLKHNGAGMDDILAPASLAQIEEIEK